MKYPIYQPYLTGYEKKYVDECFDEGWISSIGKFIDKFEKAFSSYLDVDYSITCSSGTSALHLAMLSLGIQNGDEVLLPSLTFVATSNAIAYCGATPVFVDSDEDTFLLNIDDLKKKITKKTKAVIAVNLYGNSCNFEALKQVCEEHSLYLIEDNAEAIGTTYKDRLVGTFGDVSCFSFYGNKTITTGEGGMVCTNNPDIAKKIRLYKGQGFVKNSLEYYTHSVVGYNYRMTNLAAAIGYAQINSIEEIIKKKKFIGNFYTSKLSTIDNISLQKVNSDVSSTYWLFNIICKNKTERNELALYLFENNIDSRPLFVPLNELGIYKKQKGKTPKSKKISNLVLSLPSYPELNSEDLTYITEKIYSFYLQLNKKNISNS